MVRSRASPREETKGTPPPVGDNFMRALNKVANEILNPSPSQTKGTSTYYIMGEVGNKKVCYTKNKTGFKNRWGFWSWIQTRYKKGIIKRTKFAKSGSRAKAEERAERLFRGLVNE